MSPSAKFGFVSGLTLFKQLLEFFLPFLNLGRYLLLLSLVVLKLSLQDFSALFPVDVMTTLQGVPERDRQQIRLWIDDLLHRGPGEVEMG